MFLKRPTLSAVLLTSLTFLLALGTNQLPYSHVRDVITDLLMLPGGLIAGFVFTEGAHTGHGAPTFGVWAIAANFVFYTLFWYAVLRVATHHRQKAG